VIIRLQRHEEVATPLPETIIPPARHRCQCTGCLNFVPFKRFTCLDCFLRCDKRSHRVRFIRIRRRQ